MKKMLKMNLKKFMAKRTILMFLLILMRKKKKHHDQNTERVKNNHFSDQEHSLKSSVTEEIHVFKQEQKLSEPLLDNEKRVISKKHGISVIPIIDGSIHALDTEENENKKENNSEKERENQNENQNFSKDENEDNIENNSTKLPEKVLEAASSNSSNSLKRRRENRLTLPRKSVGIQNSFFSFL